MDFLGVFLAFLDEFDLFPEILAECILAMVMQIDLTSHIVRITSTLKVTLLALSSLESMLTMYEYTYTFVAMLCNGHYPCLRSSWRN